VKNAVLPAFYALLSAGMTRAALAPLPLSGIPLVLLEAALAAVFFLCMRALSEAAFQKAGGKKAAASKGDSRLAVSERTISPLRRRA